jgi:hypothetical protein
MAWFQFNIYRPRMPESVEQTRNGTDKETSVVVRTPLLARDTAVDHLFRIL